MVSLRWGVLQVFVTCGSEAKKCFLLEAFPTLRPDHIGDSRSCSFEALVMRATGGKGVHLVLNSLADDKLQVRLPSTCVSDQISLTPTISTHSLLHTSIWAQRNTMMSERHCKS